MRRPEDTRYRLFLMAIILKELFEEVEAAAYLAVATDEACLAQANSSTSQAEAEEVTELASQKLIRSSWGAWNSSTRRLRSLYGNSLWQRRLFLVSIDG